MVRFQSTTSLEVEQEEHLKSGYSENDRPRHMDEAAIEHDEEVKLKRG
jgi:hypothetical protein